MKKKQPKDKLTRAIEAKERVIRRKREKIQRLKTECDENCRLIEKTIPKDQILLEALRSGALKP